MVSIYLSDFQNILPPNSPCMISGPGNIALRDSRGMSFRLQLTTFQLSTFYMNWHLIDTDPLCNWDIEGLRFIEWMYKVGAAQVAGVEWTWFSYLDSVPSLPRAEIALFSEMIFSSVLTVESPASKQIKFNSVNRDSAMIHYLQQFRVAIELHQCGNPHLSGLCWIESSRWREPSCCVATLSSILFRLLLLKSVPCRSSCYRYHFHMYLPENIFEYNVNAECLQNLESWKFQISCVCVWYCVHTQYHIPIVLFPCCESLSLNNFIFIFLNALILCWLT